MITLRIEHPITEYDTWARAFAQFAEARRNAGVRAHRIQRPVDNPQYVLIDLDFDDTEAAAAFQFFLTSVVWAAPENSPALAGTPRTVLLEAAPI